MTSAKVASGKGEGFVTRNRLLLVAGALAVTLASVAPPPASPAATCPPGQTGIPPYCTPCPRLSIVRVKTGANGTARITVNIEQPGSITILGKAIRTVRINAHRSGRFTRTVHLRKKIRQSLNRRGGTLLATIFVIYRSGSCTTRLKLAILFRGRHQVALRLPAARE